MTVERILYCSFCGKSQHEVAKLIAGPSTFICDECVELCNDIIADGGPRKPAPADRREIVALRDLRLRCVELARNGDRDDRDSSELLARAGAIAAFVLGEGAAGGASIKIDAAGNITAAEPVTRSADQPLARTVGEILETLDRVAPCDSPAVLQALRGTEA